MLDLTTFDFEEHAVRLVMRDGAPWFVAADVCRVLGIANNRDAVSRLEEDEKGVALTDTLGGKQNVTIVSESGLYALIFTSAKPEARRFRKWVTAEVLPAIRQTGRYEMPRLDLTDVARQDVSNWLTMIREARLLHGPRAAAEMWRMSPLPTLPDAPDAPVASGPQDGRNEEDIPTFLRERVIVTGASYDFMSARTLIDAFWAWQDDRNETRWGTRSVSIRLMAQAGKYKCPETRKTFIRSKRSISGYRGIRFRTIS